MAITPTELLPPQRELEAAEGVLQVEEYTGADAVRRAGDALNALFARQPARGFVHSPGWLDAFARHLCPDPARLHVFVLRRGAQACAALVLQELAPRGIGPLKVRRYTLPAHRHATLSDALIAPDMPAAEALHAVMRRLQSRGGALAHTFELPNLLQPGAVLAAEGADAVAQARPPRGLRLLVEPAGASAWFDVSSREAALAGMSQHQRRNLARQRRRLQELGEVRLRRHVGEAAQGEAFEAFLELEASGWKGSAGGAVGLHAAASAFYRSLLRHMQQAPQASVNLLELDGRAVAAGLCVELDDTLYVLKIAYDEQLHAAAPGNCLLEQLLADAAGQPRLRRLSLVTSPEWARRWGPREQALQRVLVLPGGLRGALLTAALRLRRRLRPATTRAARDPAQARAPRSRVGGGDTPA